MTRLQQLESTGLIERMKRLREEMNALKLTPQIVGASNLIIKEINPNAGSWDISTTLAPFQEKKFRITFVFADSKDTYSDVFIDWNTNISTLQFEVFLQDDPLNVNQPDRKSWVVVATNWNMDVTAEFYLKGIVHSADTGTITVVQI